MSVPQALSSTYDMNSGLIYERHKSLMKVCTQNYVTLQWIKGHRGSCGNDTAEELARKGLWINAIGPNPIVSLPY